MDALIDHFSRDRWFINRTGRAPGHAAVTARDGITGLWVPACACGMRGPAESALAADAVAWAHLRDMRRRPDHELVLDALAAQPDYPELGDVVKWARAA